MKALRIGESGELTVVSVPLPKPKPGEALVRIRAAGLNRADVAQRLGRYPAPPDAPPDIPGLEFAGFIEAALDTHFGPGERVFGLTGGGAQAEYLAVPQSLLLSIPPGLSDVEASVIPEAYVTAHDALFTQAGLRHGERVLIHAVASGVGLAALALCKTAGCVVFGTSRSQAKLERVRSLGIDVALLPDGFDEHVLRTTNGDGVDLILDPVGGAYFERNLAVLANRGRMVVISTMGGATASLQLAVLMRKRLQLIGTTLRNRSLQEKAAALGSFARDVLPLVAAGTIRPIIDAIYPLAQAPEAYDEMEANRTFGKIALTI
jgi:NADPH:quinone reductase